VRVKSSPAPEGGRRIRQHKCRCGETFLSVEITRRVM
jgi:hypothetical protein